MKSFLILFLTVLTGSSSQSISLQQINDCLEDSNQTYKQIEKTCFLLCKRLNCLTVSFDFYTIQAEDKDGKEGFQMTTGEFKEEFVEVFSIQWSIVSIGVCLFILVMFLDFFRFFIPSKQHNKPNNFEHSILEINNNEQSMDSDIDDHFIDIENEKRYITLEKEEAILNQLNTFELEQHFLDKNISLNVLAAKFGINHRYLSYVVNKHKRCDFATYVNELRVNYIVDRLKNEPQYLKYKISYLANQSGFASHSRFTVIFKKITGYPPSTFIQNLINEKEKNKENN